MTVYSKNITIFVTLEPELSINKKMRIVTKIKKITGNL